jgi:hypothetical protein
VQLAGPQQHAAVEIQAAGGANQSWLVHALLWHPKSSAAWVIRKRI